MQRLALSIVGILLMVVTALAQQASTPDDGSIKDGVYSNNYFGLSVAHPTRWVVQDDAGKSHIKDLAKERATSTGALSSATTEAILKDTYQLVTAFEYPLDTPSLEFNSSFMIVAEKVSHAPGIVNGRDYFRNVRPLMLQLGMSPVQDEPVEVVFSGRKFYRQDALLPTNGMTINQATIISVFKGYALAFIFTGKNQKAVDDAAKTLDTLKFTESSATPSPKLPATVSP